MPAKAIHPLWWLTGMAVALRLLAFLGRGDYVAFDEGWYLLLGINLTTGNGFTLSGLQHIALSPLYPVLAGAVNVVIGNPIWSGRLVAALTAGLLVVPCWSIFRRLAGRRTALLACVFIAVMPALAAFVAPYWIGWDLWVGAEPLFHLLLFTGLALTLRAYDSERAHDWLLAGVAFALAYLARPEAIIAFGVVGFIAGTHALFTRRPRRLVHAAVLALAFVLTAAPYWIYLHDVMGRWAITGRGVEMPVPRRVAAAPVTPAAPGGSETIEQMLWNRDQARYVQNLYALDRSGTRLASTYWGIRRNDGAAVPAPVRPRPQEVAATADPTPTRAPATAAPAPPESHSRVVRYARALARVIPFYLWPLMLLGVLGAARTWRAELVVVLPLIATSVAIARIVAIDPRTQLFVAPLAAFYLARGIRRAGVFADRRLRGAVRRRFAGAVLAGVMIVLLLGTQARRLYMSLAVGSPHHLVGAQNRRVGEALQAGLPADATVMSWHPALALYARRDWRVLPDAPFADIVRYADATDARYLVLSPYYPGPQLLDPNAREHLVVQVTAAAAAAQQWSIELHRDGGPYLRGMLRAAAAPPSGDP